MARPPSPNGPSRASHKLRAWRAARHLNGHDAAALFGLHLRTLYRYEAGQRWFPDQFKARLIELGVCDAADFLEPAPAEAA